MLYLNLHGRLAYFLILPSCLRMHGHRHACDTIWAHVPMHTANAAGAREYNIINSKKSWMYACDRMCISFEKPALRIFLHARDAYAQTTSQCLSRDPNISPRKILPCAYLHSTPAIPGRDRYKNGATSIGKVRLWKYLNKISCACIDYSQRIQPHA